MTQPSPIIEKVSEIIAPVYLVGGSLRDMLLGLDPHDFDFTTPHLPDKVEAAVKESGRHAYSVGKRFGTIGCKVDGQFVEITTFRGEQYHPRDRKPEVTFSQTLVEDLERRDFTMNAIAQDIEGNLIDPFSGVDDIHERIIRAVGDPAVRFTEDPLRMLRAARFVSQLGFSIEQKTYEAMVSEAPTIMNISHQRWTEELDKLLVGSEPVRGLDVLVETNLLAWVLPEVFIQRSDKELWGRTTLAVEGAPADTEVRWAALLSQVEVPFVQNGTSPAPEFRSERLSMNAAFVKKIGTHLHWSKKRIEEVAELASVR